MKAVQEASPDDADNAGLTWELIFPKSSMEQIYLCEMLREGHDHLSSVIFDLANVDPQSSGQPNLCGLYIELKA